MALIKGHPMASDFAMSQYSPALIRMTAEKLWLWLFWKNNLFDQVDMDGQPNTASNPKHPKTKNKVLVAMGNSTPPPTHLLLDDWRQCKRPHLDIEIIEQSKYGKSNLEVLFFRRKNDVDANVTGEKFPNCVPPPRSCMPIFPSLDKRRWCLPQRPWSAWSANLLLSCAKLPCWQCQPTCHEWSMSIIEWLMAHVHRCKVAHKFWVLNISLALGSSWYRNASWQGPFATPR